MHKQSLTQSQTQTHTQNKTLYRPRISFDVDAEELARAQRLIPHGMLKPLFRSMTKTILDLIEQHGYIAIAAIVSGKLSVIDIMKAIEDSNKQT